MVDKAKAKAKPGASAKNSYNKGAKGPAKPVSASSGGSKKSQAEKDAARLEVLRLEPRGDVPQYAHDADEEAKAPLSHDAQPPRKGEQLIPQTSFPQAVSVSLGVENGGGHCFRIGSAMKWTVPPESEARGRYRDHAENDACRREGICCGPSTVGASARVMMPMRRGR